MDSHGLPPSNALISFGSINLPLPEVHVPKQADCPFRPFIEPTATILRPVLPGMWAANPPSAPYSTKSITVHQNLPETIRMYSKEDANGGLRKRNHHSAAAEDRGCKTETLSRSSSLRPSSTSRYLPKNCLYGASTN